jgi:hypothetical protein
MDSHRRSKNEFANRETWQTRHERKKGGPLPATKEHSQMSGTAIR